MMMNIYNIVKIALFILIIVVLYILTQTKKKKYIMIIGCLLLLLLSFSVIDLFNAQDIDWFSQLEKKHETSFNQLVIKTIHDKPVLYDDINNEVVNYLFDEKIYRLKYYHPVYISDIGNYYVVIFSTDANKDYSDGLFFQSDYEYYPLTDCILLIVKETGQFIRVRMYDLIGKTIDLKAIHASSLIVGFPVLIPHQQKIAFIKSICINPSFIAGLHPISHISSITGIGNYINNPNHFIKKFVTSNDCSVLGIDNNGNVFYKVFDITFMESSSSLGTFEYQESFNDEVYLKQGYFTSYQGHIYFLGNDLNLYRLNKMNRQLIITVDNPENWLQFIKS